MWLYKRGADSWGWSFFEQIETEVAAAMPGQKRVTKDHSIAKDEMLRTALGVDFSTNYGAVRYTEDDAMKTGIVFDISTRKRGSTTNTSQWRGRQKSYYRNLAYLREASQYWLVMTRVHGIRTLLGDIEVDDLRPWLEAYEGIPQLLTGRICSRAHGDYTGMDDFKLNRFHWLIVGSDTTTAATRYVFLSSKLSCMLTESYRNLTKMSSVTTTPTPRHFPAY